MYFLNAYDLLFIQENNIDRGFRLETFVYRAHVHRKSLGKKIKTDIRGRETSFPLRGFEMSKGLFRISPAL